METVVLILMILVCFNFLLKQASMPMVAVLISAAVCAAFTALMWPYAIEQSTTQIADWLSDTALMLDIAVVLSIEVVIQMTYCLLAVYVMTSRQVRRRTLWTLRILHYFPGVLIFGVLFSLLVTMIFSFPGTSFSLVARITAGAVFAAVIIGGRLLKFAIPEEDLRLELLFLSNALIAMLGVIATVNGRTAITAESDVDWSALAGLVGLVACGALAGLLIRHLKLKRFFSHKNQKTT